MSRPVLSVVCVVGRQRARAQRLLDAVAAQQTAEPSEIVLVDFAPEEPLRLPPGRDVRCLPQAAGATLGAGRAAGRRAVEGELIAFLLDHVEPLPGWAAAVLAAFRAAPEASAIGYAFAAASSASRTSRAVQAVNFGVWDGMPGGPVPYLPGYNVAYAAAALPAGDPALALELEADRALHERLTTAGGTLVLAPAAVVSYAALESFALAVVVGVEHSRLSSAIRAERLGYSAPRRALFGLLSPLGGLLWRAPVLRRRTGDARERLGLVVLAVAAALGEGLGYLTGAGDTGRRMAHWELHAARVDRS